MHMLPHPRIVRLDVMFMYVVLPGCEGASGLKLLFSPLSVGVLQPFLTKSFLTLPRLFTAVSDQQFPHPSASFFSLF